MPPQKTFLALFSEFCLSWSILSFFLFLWIEREIVLSEKKRAQKRIRHPCKDTEITTKSYDDKPYNKACQSLCISTNGILLTRPRAQNQKSNPIPNKINSKK